MTYGKWIWAAVIILLAAYVFNLFGFKDTVNGWFSSSETPAGGGDGKQS